MLLVECNVLEKVEVINEGKEGNSRLRLRGKFQQCDEQNNNGRIYPRKILEAQVQAIQEKISDRSLVGALDHPANDAIHLSQASHVITGLNVAKDGSVIGECEILSTPNGKIVEALINDGVKIGISSRGVGSVTEGIKGKIVNEDFKLITFDLVSDPSTRGAFPELSESMRENSQRAQQIVSKHKQDRVLLTILESKIQEAMKKSKKKKKKKKKGFPDLNKDGKITFADILKGRGVIESDNLPVPVPQTPPPPPPKKKKKTPPPKKARNTHPGKRNPSTAREAPFVRGDDSTAIIGDAVLEAFKKVCWGDRYDERSAEAKARRARRKELEVKAGSQRPSLDTPDTARSKFFDAAGGDMTRAARSAVAAGTQARRRGATSAEVEKAEDDAAAKVRARTTGIRVPVKAKKRNNP